MFQYNTLQGVVSIFLRIRIGLCTVGVMPEGTTGALLFMAYLHIAKAR